MHHQHGEIEPHERDQYRGYLQQFDRVFEAMHRDIIKWLNITGSTHILDVGCGTGGVTRLLAEAGESDTHITAYGSRQPTLSAGSK